MISVSNTIIYAWLSLLVCLVSKWPGDPGHYDNMRESQPTSNNGLSSSKATRAICTNLPFFTWGQSSFKTAPLLAGQGRV